jgi:hypothetical protein
MEASINRFWPSKFRRDVATAKEFTRLYPLLYCSSPKIAVLRNGRQGAAHFSLCLLPHLPAFVLIEGEKVEPVGPSSRTGVPGSGKIIDQVGRHCSRE